MSDDKMRQDFEAWMDRDGRFKLAKRETIGAMWQAWQAAQRQGGEAVAWRVSHPDKGWEVYQQYPAWAEGDFVIQPLYTAPQPQPAVPETDWIACSEVIQAVDDETELPDEMPEEMWQRMFKDKEHAMIALRATVRETKRGIKERIEGLKRPEPPEDT